MRSGLSSLGGSQTDLAGIVENLNIGPDEGLKFDSAFGSDESTFEDPLGATKMQKPGSSQTDVSSTGEPGEVDDDDDDVPPLFPIEPYYSVYEPEDQNKGWKSFAFSKY